MDILVTVIVLLAVIAAGAFLIHRLNSQHGDRGGAAFHYGRGGVVAPDRKTDEGPAVRRRAPRSDGPADDAGARRGRGSGGRGRLRPRRRTHGVSAR
ncbi:hypothetical protein [Streptomyces tendae]|uniref:hypothetical protein n=1 Tax=Streptomyces tendae TaxID=1932 RepID=UPI00385177A5